MRNPPVKPVAKHALSPTNDATCDKGLLYVKMASKVPDSQPPNRKDHWREFWQIFLTWNLQSDKFPPPQTKQFVATNGKEFAVLTHDSDLRLKFSSSRTHLAYNVTKRKRSTNDKKTTSTKWIHWPAQCGHNCSWTWSDACKVWTREKHSRKYKIHARNVRSNFRFGFHAMLSAFVT